jgi:hypothetical protein
MEEIMPKVVYDPSKGLFQKTGTGFVGATSVQTLGGDGETISTSRLVALVDPGGSSRTTAALQAGTEAGQICIVVNVADAAESIDWDDAATSLFAGADASSTNRTLPQNVAVELVWTGTLWVPTSQTLS